MLVILATGLGNVHFQPGRPIALGETRNIQVSFDKISAEIVDIPFWKQVAFWSLVFILILIIASVLPAEWRKRLILYFLRLALFVLALFYIIKNFRTLFPNLTLGGNLTAGTNTLTGGESTPVVFTPPQVPSALLYLISLGVVLVLAGLAFLLSRWWLHKHSIRKDFQPMEDLAEIARSSLNAISLGKDWEDVIINCYARMSDVAVSQRGLHRRKDLTAWEFVARLEEAGLPGQAVRRLTRLFEAARYGSTQATHAEVAEAIACLTTVLHACGVNE